MKYRSEKVARFCVDIKHLLHQITKNQSDEADRMGVSTSVMSTWMSFKDTDRNISLAAAAAHSRVRDIAEWLCRMAGLVAVESRVDPDKLNGSPDDEMQGIVIELGEIWKSLKNSRSDNEKLKILKKVSEIERLAGQMKQEIINS